MQNLYPLVGTHFLEVSKEDALEAFAPLAMDEVLGIVLGAFHYERTYQDSFARLALGGAVVFSITSDPLNSQLTGNIETQDRQAKDILTSCREVPGPCDLRRALDAAAKCTYNASPRIRRWPYVSSSLPPEYGGPHERVLGNEGRWRQWKMSGCAVPVVILTPRRVEAGVVTVDCSPNSPFSHARRRSSSLASSDAGRCDGV
jgi:hypothetical protein